MEENFPDRSPGIVQNEFPAQGDLPSFPRPGPPPPIQVPQGEERRAHFFPMGRVQDPDGPFPLAGQAVENPPLQFLPVGNVSVEITLHLIKTTFLLLVDLKRPERKKYSLAEHAEAAEKESTIPFIFCYEP